MASQSSVRFARSPSVLAALSVIAASASAGPPGDYGDAPVGPIGAGIDAYPGVTARWTSWYTHMNTVIAPTQHAHGTWLNPGATFHLGTVPPTLKSDTVQIPLSPENDSNPRFVVYAVGPNPLADVWMTVSTAPVHDPLQEFYLNLFVDQNGDGQWRDGQYLTTPLIAWNAEWVVRDLPITMNAGETREFTFMGMRLENPTASKWVRAVLSDAPLGAIYAPSGPGGTAFWDTTMIPLHAVAGEVEDFLVDHQTLPPGAGAPEHGIWYWWDFDPTQPPPSPPGVPKPVCILKYIGPYRVGAPWCGDGVVRVTLGYASRSFNDGCNVNPDAMWAAYVPKRIAGVPVPPVIAWVDAALTGAGPVTCADGTVVNVPAVVDGQGILRSGMVPVASLTGANPIVFDACYPAPRRFRLYRMPLRTATCGSAHETRTSVPGPELPVNLFHAASTVEVPGFNVDHVDLYAGGLEEEFQSVDPSDPRPFPDPDFVTYSVTAINPDQELTWYLDPDQFASPPFSLHGQNARYSVMPQIPSGFNTPYIEVKTSGFTGQVLVVGQDGTALPFFVLPTTGFDTQVFDLPEGFTIELIQLDLVSGNIDDLYVHLDRPALEPFEEPSNPPCAPCAADYDQNGGVDGGDLAAFFADFEAGEGCADVDNNGGVDGGDLALFFSIFEAGGC